VPQLAGEDILASDVVIPKYVMKAAGEVVNNSAALQNDNDLLAALPVGQYKIELFVHYTTNTAADFQCAWTATGTINSLGRTVMGGGTSMTSVTDSTLRFQGLALGTANLVSGNTTSANIVREDLLVDVVAAGTLQFQWAQGTANASDTTVTSASRMIITKVETF
jgi:hypothetical protein